MKVIYQTLTINLVYYSFTEVNNPLVLPQRLFTLHYLLHWSDVWTPSSIHNQ